MTPEEYDRMSHWTYDRILHAQNQWHEARRVLPPAKPSEAAKPTPHPIRQDGTGPQIAP